MRPAWPGGTSPPPRRPPCSAAAAPRLAIHLTMAWPGDPPAHHKLHLFVRYVTADGRKLQADQPIEVALAGDRTTRWTPSDRRPTDRAADRQAASESRDRDETPTARIPGPTPQSRARSDQPEARRPVWSPERHVAAGNCHRAVGRFVLQLRASESCLAVLAPASLAGETASPRGRVG